MKAIFRREKSFQGKIRYLGFLEFEEFMSQTRKLAAVGVNYFVHKVHKVVFPSK